MQISEADQKLLDRYYELWLAGDDEAQICASLKVKPSKLKSLLPWLLAHCRHRLKHETRSRLTDGRVPNLPPLTPERRAEFLRNVGAGASFEKACSVMGVPLTTLTEHWFVEDPDLKIEAEYQVDLHNFNVVKALYQRALPRDVETETETVSEVDEVDPQTGMVRRGEDGKPLVRRTSSKTKTLKTVEGCFNAQRFWATNRMPEQWSLDGQGNSGGSKGKILAALESFISEGSADEDARFDAEQG